MPSPHGSCRRALLGNLDPQDFIGYVFMVGYTFPVGAACPVCVEHEAAA